MKSGGFSGFLHLAQDALLVEQPGCIDLMAAGESVGKRGTKINPPKLT